MPTTKPETQNLRAAIELAVQHLGSQTKLASCIGVEQPTVSRAKKGAWPTSSTHVAFASWLGISISEYYETLKISDPKRFQEKFESLLANRQEKPRELVLPSGEIDLFEIAESLETLASRLRSAVPQKDDRIALSRLELVRLEVLIRMAAAMSETPDVQEWLGTLAIQDSTKRVLVALATADEGARVSRAVLEQVAPLLPKALGWNDGAPTGFSFEDKLRNADELLQHLR